jgi:hypothetical protein
MTDWPFDQPRNYATFSLRQIVFGDAPILYVTHDEDDDGWQFLNGEAALISDAAIVALSEIVERDPSVLCLADLPPDWYAWRNSIEDSWQRAPKSKTTAREL